EPNVDAVTPKCYHSTMSNEAIQEVVHELESLPEADQRLVLHFLARLKERRRVTDDRSVRANNPALENKGGLLVFTGRVDAPDMDWIRLVRDERDEELLQAALGPTPQSAPLSAGALRVQLPSDPPF